VANCVIERRVRKVVLVSGVRVHRNVQRFRGRLVFTAHIFCAALNSRLESNNKEEKGLGFESGNMLKFQEPCLI